MGDQTPGRKTHCGQTGKAHYTRIFTSFCNNCSSLKNGKKKKKNGMKNKPLIESFIQK